MYLYSYYYSSSRYSLVISKSTTFAIDNSWSSNVRISKERVHMYPFQSRFTMTANAPWRIRFKLSSSVGYNSGTPSYSGMFSVVNPQIAYSTSFLCLFRQYTSYTYLAQETEYTEAYADSYSVSGSTLSMVVPKSMTINSAYYYELTIMPIGINAAGCTAGGCASQSGFQQVNFESFNMIAYANPAVGPSVANQQVQMLYKYDGPTRLALQ